MPPHITLCTVAVLQEFALVFLFFASLLLHNSMDFRLAHARHVCHVCFHLFCDNSSWSLVTATADQATPNTIQDQELFCSLIQTQISCSEQTMSSSGTSGILTTWHKRVQTCLYHVYTVYVQCYDTAAYRHCIYKH